MDSQVGKRLNVRTGLLAGRACGPLDEKCCMAYVSEDGTIKKEECGWGPVMAYRFCKAREAAHPNWTVLDIFACG